MCLTERGTNTKKAMRAGGKMIMIMVLIITISSEMIGTGKQIHPTEIRGQISDNLLETMEASHYHITTLFWALTGNAIITESNPLCYQA